MIVHSSKNYFEQHGLVCIHMHIFNRTRSYKVHCTVLSHPISSHSILSYSVMFHQNSFWKETFSELDVLEFKITPLWNISYIFKKHFFKWNFNFVYYNLHIFTFYFFFRFTKGMWDKPLKNWLLKTNFYFLWVSIANSLFLYTR